MKATDIPIGTRVRYKDDKASTSVVIGYAPRQGDEVVVVEDDDHYSVDTTNVNDLEVIDKNAIVPKRFSLHCEWHSKITIEVEAQNEGQAIQSAYDEVEDHMPMIDGAVASFDAFSVISIDPVQEGDDNE